MITGSWRKLQENESSKYTALQTQEGLFEFVDPYNEEKRAR